MADLWHPIGGICISDLGDKRYLFQFFNEIDVQRVISGTPWFFNGHLLILQRIQQGEVPSMLVLNHTEFWIQVHEIPVGMMAESMGQKFGDFLGKFLEYDASSLALGRSSYMRIRVHLDVTAPLKRKKKIQMGDNSTAYVYFKYEKLSLFCFICGKLGHGESFCPLRLKIEPSKISDGWDLALHAVARRRNTMVSRWLREADGSQSCKVNMKSGNQSNSSNWENNFRRKLGSDFGNQMMNPNLILVGTNQQNLVNRNINDRNLGKSGMYGGGLASGPMDIVLGEENTPLESVEGKKRQRIVMGHLDTVGINAEGGSHDLTASSGD
ncbi:hypothetical protein J1N35_026667 [Gossypium stocksii]|uniref:CCHC-type domain-containing protein n=1 Tax=Gossypium stocksii TaxID=47602 RepID=A0A9D3V8A9_9ROSI|nr:hypothetical protein J1N35_026667 [Gossypium stocksii]